MCNSLLKFVGLLCLAALPYTEAAAAVRINEIAWMGTDLGGANCEWIELYNSDAATVDLSAWSVVITNAGSASSKIIDLSEEGSTKYSGVAGNGFYLIARNSGACPSLVPATTADWLGSFGSGISNTGSTIHLMNGTEEVDEVNAEGGWTVAGGIGGKNTSGSAKQTPQYTSGGWLTALPTPRSVNASVPVDTLPDDHDDDEETSPPVVTIGGATPVTPVASPIIKIYLDPGPDRVVSVGAHTPYKVVVYDGTGRILPSPDVSWNFGDGGNKKGASVEYAYQEAGEYMAIVRATERGQSSVATLTVVADSSEVRVADVSDKGITLVNESGRLLDLSSWKLSNGKKKFTLPKDTALRANSSLLLSPLVTKLATSTKVSLLFPDDSLVTAYTPEQKPIAVAESIQKEEEALPPAVVTSPPPVYAKEVRAPSAPAQLAAVGAAVLPGTVLLKEDQPSPWASFASFFGGIVGSVGSLVVP